MKLLRLLAIFVVAASHLIPDTWAQGAGDYPNKPIRIYTGSAGGSNDAAARLIAQGISGPLGQQVIVDNRAAGGPGAVSIRGAHA